jgi:hypothetical protein
MRTFKLNKLVRDLIVEFNTARGGLVKFKTLSGKELKNAKNGAFKKGHFIENLSLPADNEWVKYYASDPERFPEVENE